MIGSNNWLHSLETFTQAEFHGKAGHEVSTCADLKCVSGGVLELVTSWLP